MTLYRFQLSKNIDCSKLCENWNNFGDRNEKYILEGPFGESICINSKTHQGYQFGYNSLMMEWMSKNIIEKIWQEVMRSAKFRSYRSK